MNALDRAIEAAGSLTALAIALGIQPPSVSEWRARGRVPVSRCRDVVRVTHGAVSLSDLRPDIWPPNEQEPRNAA